MAALDLDDNGVPTSAQYQAPGTPNPGANEWVQFGVSADGAHETLGAKADAAVTTSGSTASGMAFLKGLTSLLTSILAKLTAGAASMVHLADGAAATTDAGIGLLGVRRDTAGTQTSANGDWEQVQLVGGRVRVVAAADETDPTNSFSTALEASRTVKATAGKLWGFQGHVDATATADGFIQLYNNASGATTGTPVVEFPIVKGTAFSMDFGRRGRAFSAGIVIAFSSVQGSFTTGGTKMYVDAQYD